MTRFNQKSPFLLTLLIFILGSLSPFGATAATKQTHSPQSTPRFVVFEAFLNPA
jgi:hypothetical protein